MCSRTPRKLWRLAEWDAERSSASSTYSRGVPMIHNIRQRSANKARANSEKGAHFRTSSASGGALAPARPKPLLPPRQLCRQRRQRKSHTLCKHATTQREGLENHHIRTMLLAVLRILCLGGRKRRPVSRQRQPGPLVIPTCRPLATKSRWKRVHTVNNRRRGPDNPDLPQHEEQLVICVSLLGLLKFSL